MGAQVNYGKMGVEIIRAYLDNPLNLVIDPKP